MNQLLRELLVPNIFQNWHCCAPPLMSVITYMVINITDAGPVCYGPLRR
jgi:hypothetical protein